MSEENKRTASASLPNIFATKIIQFTGTGSSIAFLLNALAIFFNSCTVERLSSSEIKKTSLAAFGCKVQVIIELKKKLFNTTLSNLFS